MAVFAARYARAFADVVASENLNLDEVEQQLEDFSATWAGSPELREVLSNPAMPVDQRIAILDKINTRVGVGPIVRNFIALMINHGRMEGFDEVLSEYRRERNKRLGIAEAQVTTARKLDDSERRDLEQQVGKVAGSKVQATFVEDSALLGGVVVRIGSTVYDGSVRGRLEKLKQDLVAG